MVTRLTSMIMLISGNRIAEVEALFDTGATKSFVDITVAEKLGYVKYEKPRAVYLATKDAKAEVIGEVVARVVIEGIELPLRHVFGVIKDLRHPCIVGMDIIEPYELVLDVRENKVKFRRYPPTLEII